MTEAKNLLREKTSCHHPPLWSTSFFPSSVIFAFGPFTNSLPYDEEEFAVFCLGLICPFLLLSNLVIGTLSINFPCFLLCSGNLFKSLLKLIYSHSSLTVTSLEFSSIYQYRSSLAIQLGQGSVTLLSSDLSASAWSSVRWKLSLCCLASISSAPLTLTSLLRKERFSKLSIHWYARIPSLVNPLLPRQVLNQ
jgi:hypothetical protein